MKDLIEKVKDYLTQNSEYDFDSEHWTDEEIVNLQEIVEATNEVLSPRWVTPKERPLIAQEDIWVVCLEEVELACATMGCDGIYIYSHGAEYPVDEFDKYCVAHIPEPPKED